MICLSLFLYHQFLATERSPKCTHTYGDRHRRREALRHGFHELLDKQSAPRRGARAAAAGASDLLPGRVLHSVLATRWIWISGF